MQLLDKREITQKKNFERELEVKEGLKLARKIDSLRETAATEESRLFKFREESLKKIKADMSLLGEQKAALENNIASLEKRRAALMEPLTEEWEQVRVAKANLDRDADAVAEKISRILESERDLEKRKKLILLDEDRIQVLSAKAEKLTADAGIYHLQAKDTLRDASAERDNAVAFSVEKTKLLTVRENEVAAKERDIMNMSKALEKKEKALADKDREIKDRYQTLLNTEARIKKNG